MASSLNPDSANTASTNPQRKSTERTHSSSGITSHGRGGAGNFGAQPSESIDPTSLETPTIKSKVYTTGRGGTGNMAKNESAEEARRAQDVVAAPRRPSANNQHVGRGGEGNVFKPTKAELEKAKREGNGESAIADDVEHHQQHGNGQKKGGLLDKAKELFGGGKKSGEEKR